MNGLSVAVAHYMYSVFIKRCIVWDSDCVLTVYLTILIMISSCSDWCDLPFGGGLWEEAAQTHAGIGRPDRQEMTSWPTLLTLASFVSLSVAGLKEKREGERGEEEGRRSEATEARMEQRRRERDGWKQRSLSFSVCCHSYTITPFRGCIGRDRFSGQHGGCFHSTQVPWRFQTPPRRCNECQNKTHKK